MFSTSIEVIPYTLYTIKPGEPNIWSTTWQKERENKHDEWLSFREIGCTIYWDW